MISSVSWYRSSSMLALTTCRLSCCRLLGICGLHQTTNIDSDVRTTTTPILSSSPSTYSPTSGSRLRIAVGISGGVDSAVTALLLKRQGHDVIGVHMTNWSHQEEGDDDDDDDDDDDEQKEKKQKKNKTTSCEGQKDADDAAQVCRELDIPFERVSFERRYWNEVFEPFLHGIRHGITPNPDSLCNQRIKFSAFISYCREKFNVSYVATGHYARLHHHAIPSTADSKLASSVPPPLLLRGADHVFDQSYFLCEVKSESFRHSLFPLGEYTKDQVRQIALDAKLSNHARRSSTGLCFIGKRKFRNFIREYISEHDGTFIDTDGKLLVHRHSGHECFTIGQRAHISRQIQPLYVSSKDASSNSVTVVPLKDHPALYCEDFFISVPHALRHNESMMRKGDVLQAFVITRFRSLAVPCSLQYCGTDNVILYVRIQKGYAIRAVTPGQVAALYGVTKSDDDDNTHIANKDLCLGGATIIRPGISFDKRHAQFPDEHLRV